MIRGFRVSAFLAIALSLGACGGGSGGESEPAPAPPPAPAPIHPPVVMPVHPTFQQIDAVVGQDRITADKANRLGEPNANTLSFPSGAAVDEIGRLFVADTGNNRVLIYERVPEQHDAAAMAVLGQANMESAGEGVGQGRLSAPMHVAVGAGKLALTDWGNNRVLVYSTIPSATGQLPDAVVGQLDFDTSADGCLGGLRGPMASTITPDGRLIVADTNNHRVLVWPLGSHSGPPEFVLGQLGPDECRDTDVGGDGNPDVDPASRFNYPVGVWSNGSRLVVATGPRVLVWATFPTENFQAADLVLGQDDFNQFDLPLESGRSVGFPTGVSSDGNSLAVADTWNHRVLLWNNFPTANGQQPNSVLGVDTFTKPRPDIFYEMARSFDLPTGVLLLPTHTLVLDTGNSRVAVFRRPAQQ